LDKLENSREFDSLSKADLAGHASVRDIFSILFVHKWVILISFIILLSAILWGLSLRKTFFVATVEYYVDRSNNQEMGITYTPNMDYEEEMNSIAELGRSRGVLNDFAREYDKLRGWENPPAQQTEIVASALAEYIDVSPVPETNMIQIKVRDADPDTALAIADIYSQVFHEEYKRINRPEASREFVQNDIKQLEARIQDATQAKAELQSNSMIFDRRAVETRLAENKAIFERDLTNTRIKRRTLESQLDRDKTLFEKLRGKMIPSTELRNDPLVERYENRLADLNMSMAELQAKYKPDYPLVIAKKAEIEDVLQQKDSAIDLNLETRAQQVEGLRESEQILEETIANVEQELRDLPLHAGDIKYYDEFLDMQWSLYARLVTKFNDKLVDKEFTIMDRKLAKLGEPVISDIEGATPMVVYALVAPLFAFVLAISAAFMVEATGQSFQKPADVEDYTGLPVFATFKKI